jgi:signal transduction histidine kinase
MPFEMIPQTWQDEVERLRQENELLQSQLAARTASLQESDRRLQAIADLTADWVWETDAEHRFTYVGLNSPVAPYQVSAFIGRTRWQVFGGDPETDPKWSAHRADLEARRPFRRLHCTYIGPEGQARVLAISGKPQFDAAGRFLGYRGIGSDETDLVQARSEAAEAGALLHDAMDSLPQGLALFDADDRLIMCNQAFRTLHAPCAALLQPGIAYADLLRHAIARNCFPEAAGQEEAWLATRLAQHRSDGGAVELAVAGDRWVLITERRTSSGGVVAFHADVTQRKLMEQQLVQAVKMEAIGTLTGGLAHDFNNLLAVIIANLDLLHTIVAEEAGELARDALEAALRGADLTHRLLAFARRQALHPERLDVNALIAGVSRLLGRLVGPDVEVALHLNPNIWPVLVDGGQLETALTNLAANARDAMARGGRITIATHNWTVAHGAAPDDPPPGEYVAIEVTDTGSGISADLLERIFEPFFTTKEQGKGTGLGLSMVFGFVKQSGGHVSVGSEPGRGTTFRLFFPRIAVSEALGAEAASEALPDGGSERILVVEDNGELRRAVLRQLRQAGYRVHEAADAAAALRLIDTGGPFDLLLTDIVMPGGMSGEELAHAVRQRRPEMRILLTTGFTAASRGDVPLPGRRLLRKPFRGETLLRSVRDALDG